MREGEEKHQVNRFEGHRFVNIGFKTEGTVEDVSNFRLKSKKRGGRSPDLCQPVKGLGRDLGPGRWIPERMKQICFENWDE